MADITNTPQDIKGTSNLISTFDPQDRSGRGISSLSDAIGNQAREAISAVGNFQGGAGALDYPVMKAEIEGSQIPDNRSQTQKEWEDATKNISLENAPNLALDAMGIANFLGKGNPYTLAATTARNLYNWGDRYNDQRPEDRINFGVNSNPLASVLRTAPMFIGDLFKYFGPQPDDKYSFSKKAQLANLGIDYNDYRGQPIAPSFTSPVSGPFGLPAFEGLIASPWVNPNIPNPNPMIDLNAIQQRAVQAEQAAQKQAQNDAYLTQQQNDMIDSGDYNDDDYGAMFDGIDDFSVG